MGFCRPTALVHAASYGFYTSETIQLTHGEECHLGDVVIENGNALRCVQYSPAAGPIACAEWEDPKEQHLDVVDHLLFDRPETVKALLAKYGAENVKRSASSLELRLDASGKGGIAIRTTGSPRVEIPAEGKKRKDNVKIAYEFRSAYLNLGKDQDRCLSLQRLSGDVTPVVDLKSGERVLGYVARANLGMAAIFSAPSVELAHNGANIACSALSAPIVLGTLNPAAMEKFLDALKKDGDMAAAGSGHVRQPATISIEVRPFTR